MFEIFRGLGLRQDGENDYDKDVVRHVKVQMDRLVACHLHYVCDVVALHPSMRAAAVIQQRERIPLKTPEQLNDIATQCRRQTDTEGVVLYLLGKSDGEELSPANPDLLLHAAQRTLHIKLFMLPEHTSSNQQLQTIGLVKVKTNT